MNPSSNDHEILWGRYRSSDNLPETRFDPLQSYFDNDEIVGFRIHVIKARGKRPRELKRNPEPDRIEGNPKDSILYQISHGLTPSIPLASENKMIGKVSDTAREHHLGQYSGITMINKFSPLLSLINDKIEHEHKTSGVALVSYSNTYTENLVDIPSIVDILRSLFTTIGYYCSDKAVEQEGFKYFTSIIFFNVGLSSGASLRQLHAQAYLLNNVHGQISSAFFKAYASHEACFTCKMANSYGQIKDHLGQEIDIDRLIIWEDTHMRLIHPYAEMRPFSLRILPKGHFAWVGEFSTKGAIINSLAKALHLAHITGTESYDFRWHSKLDHSISFRQSKTVNDDFHMIIDILSTIPLGGAELVDSLSITSLDPELVARRMKKYIEEYIHRTNI